MVQTEWRLALTAGERAGILDRLLAERPDLTPTVDGWSADLLGAADAEAICDAVVDTFRAQPFTVISDRVGRLPGRGYVDESEAQYEVLVETMRPWLDDARRRCQAGFADAARVVTVGLLRGLAELGASAPQDALIGWGEGEETARQLADDVVHRARTWGLPGVDDLLADAAPAWTSVP